MTQRAINENLLQQAIALYEHLLQDAEWPTATILDIAEKVAMGPFGSNIKVSTFVPEGVPIISGNHLRGYFLEETEFNYITEEHAERLKNSIVFPRDLVFTHAGNIGQVAMIPDECKFERYVLSQRQFYLRCNETMTPFLSDSRGLNSAISSIRFSSQTATESPSYAPKVRSILISTMALFICFPLSRNAQRGSRLPTVNSKPSTSAFIGSIMTRVQNG